VITLRDAVVDNLTTRRALGFKLREHEWALESFVSFLERAGASTITTELALQWACDTRGTEGWKAARLSMVTGFAVYLRTIEPATDIPPTGLLLHRKRYAIPYLYTDEEIGRLLAEAAGLRPERRAMLHGTVIGLLAVTGMRISEALGLDCDDVDLDAGVLTIRAHRPGEPGARTGFFGGRAAGCSSQQRTARTATEEKCVFGAADFRSDAIASSQRASTWRYACSVSALRRCRSGADRQTSRRPKAGRRRDARCELYGDEHRGSSRRTHTVVTPSPARARPAASSRHRLLHLLEGDEVSALRDLVVIGRTPVRLRHARVRFSRVAG